jgi:hypothetical protein
MKSLSKSKAVLYTMIFLIGLIGVMDNIMNIQFMDTLEANEKNPIALWLIKRWGIPNFVIIKSIGVVSVVSMLCLILKSRWRYFIISSVFAFQVWLFAYLSYYCPTRGFTWNNKVSEKNVVIESTIDFYKTYFNEER